MPNLREPSGVGSLQGMFSKLSAPTLHELKAAWLPFRPDPTDAMDQTVWSLLSGMEHEALSRLMVRRLFTGKYEIDGRRVSVYWGPHTGEGPATADNLLVREDEVGGEEGSPELPLPAYLQQAANVAAALHGRVPGAAAVTRIPQEKRLTFSSGGSGALENLDVLQRCASMRKACEEAALRERAAEAYENGIAYVALPKPTSELDVITAGQYH